MIQALIVIAATLITPAFTQAEWSLLVARLQKAAPLSSAQELRAVRDALAVTEPTNLERYTLAYTNRVLAFALGTTAAERKQLLAEATALLEANVAADARDAESHALLGSVYGASIGVDPSRGAELGAKASASLARALQLAPHNPRVHLLHGTSAFHRPEEYGGGAKVAEPHLRRALELFRQEPEQKPWPNWGRFDAHVYLGQTLEKLQRRDDALRSYEAALAIAPDSAYVRRVLMPRLRK